MRKFTRKYKKNNRTKSMKKHKGGMKKSQLSLKYSKKILTLMDAFLPRPGRTDSHAHYLNLLERGESPFTEKKSSSSSSEYHDALEGTNELFEQLQVREQRPEIRKSLRKTRNRKNHRKNDLDPVFGLLFRKEPHKLKIITDSFKKIDNIKKYPDLPSITRAQSKKSR